MAKIVIPIALIMLALTAGCGQDDEKSFGRVDLNKDGKVIFEEGIIAYPDLTIEEFRLYDKDGGGALSGEEYAVFLSARASGTPPKVAEKPAGPPPAEPAAPPPAPAPEPAADPAPVPPEPSPPTSPEAQPTPPPAAAPVVQEPAAPAAPAAESVEVASTMAQPAPEAKPAGPSEIAYTVQRGDTLNKIARKFKVGVKDIVARNAIDNPDKVTAGQVLDIPLRPDADQADAAKNAPDSDMAAFVETFFARSGAAAPDELLTLYADEVDFYKKGVVKKDFVLEDKVRYFERWPTRSYTPMAKPTVTAVPGTGRLRIDVPVRYQVKNADKSASGEALFVFEVVTEGGTPRIVSEDSTVTAKP